MVPVEGDPPFLYVAVVSCLYSSNSKIIESYKKSCIDNGKTTAAD